MTELIPALLPGVICAEQDEKWLLLNPEIPDWLVVNHNAAHILSTLTHPRPIKQMALDFALAPDTIRRLVQLAERHGILGDATCVNTSSSDTKQRAPLQNVHWKLTGECNLRCKYCYAGSEKGSRTPSLKDLQYVADDIHAVYQNITYTLSGGEPLIHPNALDFSEYLKNNGNSIALLTNGTLINNNNIERISKIFDLIKISLDGSSEDIHAITRGWGNYSAVISSMESLIARGCNVVVAMTVHKRNCHDVEAMSKRYGSHLIFQPLFNAGRGAQRHDLMLSGEEYYDSLAGSKHIAPLHGIEKRLQSLRGKGSRRCSMAEKDISISETLDIYPCQLLTHKEYKAGNALKTHVQDILDNSTILQNLRAIHVDTIPKCFDCPIKYLCAGGCLARNYYQTGRVDVCGDFCEYEQQAIFSALFACPLVEVLPEDNMGTTSL